MRPIRAILPLVLLAALSACQTWHGRPLPGPEPAPLPSPVRVVLRDGSSLVMWHPAVERDSVVGLVGRREGERTRAAVSLAQVTRMDRRGVDPVATAGVSALATLGAVIVIALIALGAEW
jgi:hypothetical protein